METMDVRACSPRPFLWAFSLLVSFVFVLVASVRQKTRFYISMGWMRSRGVRMTHSNHIIQLCEATNYNRFQSIPTTHPFSIFLFAFTFTFFEELFIASKNGPRTRGLRWELFVRTVVAKSSTRSEFHGLPKGSESEEKFQESFNNETNNMRSKGYKIYVDFFRSTYKKIFYFSMWG